MREQLVATRAKEEEKKGQQSVKLATSLSAKIEPVLTQAQELLGNPSIGLVSDELLATLRDYVEKFETLKGKLRKVVKHGRDRDNEVPDPKDLQESLSLCKKQIALVTGILAMCAKSASRR